MNQSHSNVSISNPNEKVNTQKSNDNSNDITPVNTNISEDDDNYFEIETDSPIMTAPQLSVDTVSESVYKDNVAHKENTVKNNISIDGSDKEKDTEPQSARVTDENEGQRSAKDSVSNNKLAQK